MYTPDPRLYTDPRGRPAPWLSPVFYNPQGAVTRDVSVALASTLGGGVRMLDAMAGVGVRGLRCVLEAHVSHATLNDVNPDAAALACLAASRNGVSHLVDVQSMGCNALCALSDYGRGYDVVDIDPFGSAAPFISNGVIATANQGILGVCSTDGANLCGNRPQALTRLYAAVNRAPYARKEVGLRILAANLVLKASTLGCAVTPVACYCYHTYFRVHVRVVRSPRKASSQLSNIGYVPGCLHRDGDGDGNGNGDGYGYMREPSCRKCGEPASAGPVYTGPLGERETLEAALKKLGAVNSATAYASRRLVETLASENGVVSLYLDIHEASKKAGVGAPPLHSVLDSLADQGYAAYPTHFSPTSVKTDAPPEVFEATVGRLGSR